MSDSPTEEIAICGTGAVARTFARLFSRKGAVHIVSRDRVRADAAAADVSPKVHAATYDQFPERASRAFIAVTDEAIVKVAAVLCEHPLIRIALHTSGCKDVEALSPLSSRGVSCGAVHPLQTITGEPDDVDSLCGAAFAISGSGEAFDWAQSIAALAGGEPLLLSPGARAVYHAASVFASNYITACISAGEELLATAGVLAEQSRRALRRLAETAVRNACDDGPEKALTGPIARGDAETVGAHLHAIEGHPTLDSFYRAAGQQALELSERRGLPVKPSQKLRALLTHNS